MTDLAFSDLADMLSGGDLVVVNETRVRSARLNGFRSDSGGRVELLVLSRSPTGWECLARPARRLRRGLVLEFGELSAEIVSDPSDGLVVVEFDVDDVETALEEEGTVPLPPYFTGVLDNADRYQTVFAQSFGSAAAPTAGLHFTKAVLESLRAKTIGVVSIDLHVGIDTFRPMAVHQIEDHKIHSEWCEIPEGTAEAIAMTRQRGGEVIAIGTTTARTLESLANPDGTVRSGQIETDLFLKPGSKFHVVDGLVTNFHVPGSTLVVMVAAFMGARWRPVYEEALRRGYRFLSFGDAMFARREDR